MSQNSKKVLFINQSHPILIDQLEAFGYECVLNLSDDKATIEETINEYVGIVIRSRINIDKQLIDKAIQLQFIGREGAGVEHIDVEYAESKNIRVLTTPEGSRDAVGEHALGMLLGLIHHLSRADRQVRAGKWIREGNRGVEIKGKTIGIIGYGNMGQSFARKVSGFEAKVLAYDKFKTDYGDDFAEEASLERLFAEADIISLHIPFLEENYHFVNDAFIRSFAKNIYLVNTARGTVLNTEDLVQHLKTGKVLGAALDVLEYEESTFQFMCLENMPAPFEYLIQADNVVLAPHIAGWSVESKKKHSKVLGEKIIADFIKGVGA